MRNKEFEQNLELLKKGVVHTQDEIDELIKQVKKYKGVKVHRVCGYGRVSTKHEEQESSLLTQHTILNNYCMNHLKEGYVLVEEVFEQRSGTVITKRKKFMQMIEDARNGCYDTLLFKDCYRFSRSMDDFVNVVDSLKELNIAIVFIAEGVNTLTAPIETIRILGMMAESFSNGLHKSCSAALQVKFNSDLGRVPGDLFGYKRHSDDTRYADIVPEQAEIIRELFNRYANGEGLAYISRDFNNRGITNYRGNKMSTGVLKRWIRQPLYKGLLIMNVGYKPTVRSKRKARPEDERIIRNRPDLAIVDEDLWQRANDVMDSNRLKQEKMGCFVRKTDTVKSLLFQRVITCGDCGRYYVRKDGKQSKSGKKYVYLMCGFKKYSKNSNAGTNTCSNEEVIRLDTLIELMSLYFKDLILNQENIKEIINNKIVSIMNEIRRKESDKSLDDEIKNARAKLKRLVDLYKDGLVDREEYIEAKSKVKELELEAKANSIPMLTEEQVNALTEKFINQLEQILIDGLSDDSNIDVAEFNKLFDRITVYQDHIDIVFNVLKQKYRRLEEISIDKALSDGLVNLDFICPIVDNHISRCKPVDKCGNVDKMGFCPINCEKVMSRECEPWLAIEDRELRNKVRKNMRRGRKTKVRCVNSNEYLCLNEKALLNMHSYNVVAGIRNVKINLYIV